MPLPLSNSTNTTRITDLYTKEGDIGVYSSMLVLSPDHNAGFTILTAGLNSHGSVVALSDLLAATFMPAFEQAARDVAATTYAGAYTSSTSNATITLDPSRPGLGLSNWYSNGVDMLSTLKTLTQNTDPSTQYSARLYPMQLSSGNKTAFRAIFEALPKVDDSGAFSETCESWVTVDGQLYGGVGLDEFLFETESDGKVKGLEVRALRETLVKA
jgi:hypothetical protein